MTGLTEREAARRRAAGQGNAPARGAGRTYAGILREHLLSPVNAFLFATCIALVWLGLPIDAAVTAVPVGLNVLAGVVLEARAKRQLDHLAIVTSPLAIVRREGRDRKVAPGELVIGDLVVIARGDQVVLDGQIVSGAVDVDESPLTGESEPVARGPGDAVLSGSACLDGSAMYAVTRLASQSFAGTLVQRAREARTERTPLQRDVARLVAGFALLVALVSAVVAIDFWRGGPLAPRQAVQAAAVLIAIVPQGLVIISTLMYALAALSISRSGVLVQRMSAVESLSRADTLVLDKTGTLTSPRIELSRCEWLADESSARTALGHLAAEPAFTDRTSVAIRSWLGGHIPREQASGAAEVVPFASDRRWSGVRVEGDGAVILGAPEVLARHVPGSDVVLRLVEVWAADGLRVLLLARVSHARLHDSSGVPRLPGGLAALAVLAFTEELRPDAKPILDSLAAAGVRLKVASGDHGRTVAAIATRVGLDGAEPVDGTELASLDDASVARRAEAASVFGRVEPALKARLVRALRRSGHFVAMVGDGVNDIIALRQANVALAMQSGSPAARAASDLVLLGDSFAPLPRVVAAGQRIVQGMRVVACLLLTRSIAALLLILGSSLLGLEFPFTPRTNAVLALLTVGIPSLLLPAWAPAGRSPGRLVSSALRFSIPAGIAVTVLGFPVYWSMATVAGDLAAARSAVATIGVLCGIVLIPFLLPPGPRRDVRPTVLAAVMVLAYTGVLLLPGLRDLFEIAELPSTTILGLIGLAGLWGVTLHALRAVRVVPRLIVAARRFWSAARH